jgi:hypothetical protein
MRRGYDRYAPQPPQPAEPYSDDMPAVTGPLIVRFLEEDDTGYLVGDPWSDRTARVSKHRAIAEPFSPDERRRGASERLLRWSAYALVGVICGGIPAILLGGIVALAALIRLSGFSSRIHRWRKRRRASGEHSVLPVHATHERIQVLAALGQGLLAVALGSGVLFVIVEMR